MVTIREAVAAALLHAARHESFPRSSVRHRATAWAVCAAAFVALGFSGLAAAQQSSSSNGNANRATTSSTASTQQPSTLQQVVVTGTHIKRTTGYTSPTPTTVINTQTMQNQGIINVSQAMSLVSGNDQKFSRTANPSGAFHTGQSIADLRGLNGYFNSRTLTLVDSQRIVPTSVTDSFDLNMLPQILVERIVTVTGGASATYGSGAEAGVLNVILNRNLNGGKLDGDFYDTHYNDARDHHYGFAYGKGFFNDRAHFVIGAEYEKQDPANCDGRPWCDANFGPYTTQFSPELVHVNQLGSGLTRNAISSNGVLGASAFNPATFNFAGTAPGAPLFAVSNSGLNVTNYTGNGAIGGGANVAPGGQGLPVNFNAYTNLLAPVTRGLITTLFTFKLPAHVTMKFDFNFGKVETTVPGGTNFDELTIGTDNPFLPNGVGPGGTSIDTNMLGAPLYLGKDFTPQIPNSVDYDTTLTRGALDFSGPIGQSSSWTWDAFLAYGRTKQTETLPTDFHENESSMALDTVMGPNGQPECRITQAANSIDPGNPNAALRNNPQAVLAAALASARSAYPSAIPPFANLVLPSYLQAFANSQGSFVPPDPLTGLNLVQAEGLLGQNCVPLNPFGSSPLSKAAINYATGPVSLKIRLAQTNVTLSSTGNFYRGIGAGPFSVAFGYEWRQLISTNHFTSCPEATTLCLQRTTDTGFQFGDPFGVDTTVNEGYLELNFPLLKNRPYAHQLDVDIAGRESSYDNKTLFGVQIPSGSFTHLFTTWKATLSYEPIVGVRLRATQSRDERAPNARDIGYSQIFVAGSGFASCRSVIGTNAEPCNINLTGNPSLSPESTNTETVGLVFTPPQLPGFQFSADWFKIHLFNGIEGGSPFISVAACGNGHGAAACPGFSFNNVVYNAAGQPCGGAVNCTGVATFTGAQAYQLGNVSNILGYTAPAFNGADYNTRGIDFSLDYFTALPDGSTLAVRLLTTWVGQQTYQNYKGGPIEDILGQTGNASSFLGLGDFQNDPRWRGNISVTWTKGPWSITPNVSWIGQGTLDNQGLSCTEAQLMDNSNPCNWVFTGYTHVPAQDAVAAATLKALSESILPLGVKNHVPFYAIFGLNATYTLQKVLKGLQVYGQVYNLFNKTPPFTNGYTSNPVFFDQLGQAYRVGFRLRF